MDEIFEFRPNIISVNPKANVQIVNAVFAEKDQDFVLMIDIINMSQLNVTSIDIEACFINDSGKKLFDGTFFSYNLTNLSIPPNEIYYLSPWELDERHHTARSAQIYISKVTFEDDSNESWKEKESIFYTLPIIPLEKLQKLQSFFGYDLISYASIEKKAWRCVCGATNPIRNKKCKNCQRGKDFVLNTLTENRIEEKLNSSVFHDLSHTIGVDNHNRYLLQRVEDIEGARGHSEEDSYIKSVTPLPKKIFLTILGLIIALFIFYGLLFFVRNLHQWKSLEEAEKYIQTQEYQKALTIYENLPPDTKNVDIALKIEDTKNLIKSKDMYRSGIKKSIEGESLEALYYFTQVVSQDKENYTKARAMIMSIKQDQMQEIEKLMSQGDEIQAFIQVENLLRTLPTDQEVQSLEEKILAEIQKQED